MFYHYPPAFHPRLHYHLHFIYDFTLNVALIAFAIALELLYWWFFCASSFSESQDGEFNNYQGGGMNGDGPHEGAERVDRRGEGNNRRPPRRYNNRGECALILGKVLQECIS